MQGEDSIGQPKQLAICHPDRAYYAKGLCRKCSDSIRSGGDKARQKVMLNISDNYSGKEELKQEFLRDAKRLVDSIRKYTKPPESERRYIETRKPKVAEFVASVAIKNALDMQKTAEELKPDLRPYEQAELAQTLDSDPNVKREVEKQLEKRGLDAQSKERFVELLWAAAESTDPRREREKLQAWRLLGKAFIPEQGQLQITPPEELRIKGFDEGLKRMLGVSPGDPAQAADHSFGELRGSTSNLAVEFDA